MNNIFIDIHSHKNRIDSDIITIYNLKPQEILDSKFVSQGIHPWDINQNPDFNLKEIKGYLKNKQLTFIGECGLDKLKCNDFELQQKYFILQLELANTHKLPVIIHCVKAFEETINLLSNYNLIPAVIFHGFHKSPELAMEITSKGYYISLGKILFTLNDKSKIILEKVDHSKLFLETDDGEYLIEEAYEKAVQLSGLSLEYWKEKLHNNFKTFAK